MSIVFACIPEMLKSKVKEVFPEVTFLKVDEDPLSKAETKGGTEPRFCDELDESVHGKPRKKRESKKTVVKDVLA